MIALAQFRDTFIVAVDDEGIAIIDQHVAHERVLFERILQRLTTGRLSKASACSSRCWSSCRRRAVRRCAAHAADLERLGFELEEFGGERCASSRVPGASHDARSATPPSARWPQDLEGLDRDGPGSRRHQAHCRDDGVPCRGEGELPADVGEDGAHPRGAAADGLFDHLPAWPAGDAAVDAAGSREELSADLIGHLRSSPCSGRVHVRFSVRFEVLCLATLAAVSSTVAVVVSTIEIPDSGTRNSLRRPCCQHPCIAPPAGKDRAAGFGQPFRRRVVRP